MAPLPDIASSQRLAATGPGTAEGPLPPGLRRKASRVNAEARHSFNLFFLTPVMLIVVSAMVALVGGTLWLTALQNRAEAVNERERVKASFIARVESSASTNRGYARWDEAAQMLVNRFDEQWADINEGAYLYDHSGFDTTFVIDSAGRSIYGFVDRQRSLADPAILLGPGYVAAMRNVLSARPVFDRALGGVTLSQRGMSIFSIARIRPHSDKVAMRPGVERYLVTSDLIDRAMLGDLARAANGAPLVMGSGPRPGHLDWTIVPYAGPGRVSFLWRPAEPGTRLLHQVMPWLAGLIAVISALAALVLRRARKAARELIASEITAHYHASRDALTGLCNRRSLIAHLRDLDRRGGRHQLLFLDLDGFKKINDTFGHAVGDKVLCRTAERLQRVLPPGALLARLGGDEFSIALAAADRPADLDAFAARLIAAVGEPYRFGGEPTAVGVSIGIAADGGGDDEEIVRRADTAMYAAKQRGRNNWQHYDPSLDAGRDERRRLESDLKQALARREIFVVFQPIVDAHSQRICAVEALARWTHPTRGPISPDIFVSIAEESGLIVELGKQILEQACVAARHWPFRLAVNLSPAQFWQRDLVDEVIDTLDRCAFPASRLEFEITETYLLRRPEAAEAVIRALRRRGVRIALDDFGTGYASIGYLRRFQFDLVKIDRTLVEAIVTDAAAAEVFLAIVSLCQALRLPILAEGVETADQAAMVTGNGCAYLQGWHFGRPMLAAQVDALVGQRQVA